MSELHAKNDELIAELRAKNMELSTNKGLMAQNEELIKKLLVSDGKLRTELDTANENCQATVEELQGTIDAITKSDKALRMELRAKNEELWKLSMDMAELESKHDRRHTKKPRVG